MITVTFTDLDNESMNEIVDRFIEDYPDCNSRIDYEVNFTNDEWTTIDDVDIFLCEEICHEYETYCSITDGINQREYAYDDDEWIYN